MAKGLARSGWDLDLKYGKEAENELNIILQAHGSKIEVKRDEKCLKTGNLFIELFRKGKHNDEVPSGFSVTEADWWAFVFRPKRFLLVATDDLKKYVDRAIREGRVTRGGDYDRAKGVLVPIKWIIKE